MTLEIKKRIEQIRNGDVPEGYKRTKAGIIPEKWEIKKLSDVLKKQTQKNTDNAIQNVLTNSATQGIVCQTDYFDKQIANNENTAGYYVVKPGYFVYNPRISVSAPCGPFNRYNGDKDGIMSPLYSVYCFCDKSITYADYLTYYFSSSKWHAYMNSIANYGARSDRMNVTKEDMDNMPIPYPPLPEQQRTVAILSSQDKVIECYEKKIVQLKRMKKYYLQNMFPKRGETVPKTRFKGFADTWEQRKVGDCFEFLQNNTLSRAELSAETGAALNVHYGDVLIKFGEYLDVSVEQMAYIPNQGIVDKFKSSQLADGDVIMADTAEDETVGKCSEIAGLQRKTAIAGLHTIPLRPIGIFASGFLGYYMNSDAYHNQLLPLMQGIKVTSVSKNAIKSTNISYPVDTTEQAAIGQHFMRLDKLITLHQRLCDEEKKKKKAMQQLLLTGIVRV